MDLDWCIVCDRHTSGGIYCSQECRSKDTPLELQGKAPLVSGPLDQKKLSYFPLLGTSKLNNYRNQELDDDEDHLYRLANKVNNNKFDSIKGSSTQKKELLVSYGALTANTKNTTNATQNLKFFPRQQHQSHFQQTTHVF